MSYVPDMTGVLSGAGIQGLTVAYRGGEADKPTEAVKYASLYGLVKLLHYDCVSFGEAWTHASSPRPYEVTEAICTSNNKLGPGLLSTLFGSSRSIVVVLLKASTGFNGFVCATSRKLRMYLIVSTVVEACI